MKQLDLRNKLSPCCKRGIEKHHIGAGTNLECVYYTCEHCEGEFTATQILRANIETPKINKENFSCSKCLELEKENKKLKRVLKDLLESEEK
jgi:hypothetical protein